MAGLGGSFGTLGAPLGLSGSPLGALWGAFGCTLGLRAASGLDLKWGVGPLEVPKGARGGQNDRKGTKIIRKRHPNLLFFVGVCCVFFSAMYLDESEFWDRSSPSGHLLFGPLDRGSH